MKLKTLLTFVIGLGLSCATPVRSATPDEIDAAIARGVEWLYARPAFKENGNWELEQKRLDDAESGSETGAQWGGRTALVTYALLASGEKPSDPRLKPAVDFLRKSDDMIGTYALGLRAQVWPYIKGDEVKNLVVRDFNKLKDGIGIEGGKPNLGLYGYTHKSKGSWFDLSVSQYGVLGMWACAQFEIDSRNPADPGSNYWQLVDKKWRAMQDQETGGWAYRGGADVSPSMTAAGLATLFIAQDHLRSNQGLNCAGNQKSPAIQKAIDYLAAAAPRLFDDDARVDWRYYTIYGVERVGVASGLKYFNDIDWYQVGADYLVKSIHREGNWTDGRGDEISTAYALLFLSRGREPVMMNKIKYDLPPLSKDKPPIEGAWNQRSRDVANATHFVSRQTERPLNWQIIDLGVANIRDLRDAPIAYISGSGPIKLSADQLALLKQYVEEGGMLVFNSDCRTREFGESVTKLLHGLFPYAVELLADSHPIFQGQQFRGAKWKLRPKVRGVSNGVRQLALILDEDFGKSFQMNEAKATPEHFELMADIYQYAIDKKNSLVKGRSYVIDIDPSIKPDKVITLARVKYQGNWDPEPGGWRRVKAVLNNQFATDLQVSAVDPATTSLAPFQAVHLTGTGLISLPAAAIESIKTYVAGGGLLIVDAAGGDSQFATSVESQLTKILDAGKAGAVLLPPADPIFKSGALKTPEFRYRTFTQATVGISSAPRLRGAKVGARYGMIYSPDDLSAGLVGNEVDGIRGYTPASSMEIMTRLLFYASEIKPK